MIESAAIVGEDDLDAPDLNLRVEAVSKRDAAKVGVASSKQEAETAELWPGSYRRKLVRA
jgi:hypothetical protein